MFTLLSTSPKVETPHKIARERKKLRAARKKARLMRGAAESAPLRSKHVEVVVSVTVVVMPPVCATAPVPCRCTYDAKADVEQFENNPYYMHYVRPRPIGECIELVGRRPVR